jgi:hypothetical protein
MANSLDDLMLEKTKEAQENCPDCTDILCSYHEAWMAGFEDGMNAVVDWSMGES